jgi:hypothetical protein
MASVEFVITPPLLTFRTSAELSTKVVVPATLNPPAVSVSVGILDAEPRVSEAMLAADMGATYVTVKVPASIMDAFVPTPGTTAGDQLAALFQSPAVAAVQAVCACIVAKLAASSPAQRHIVLNFFIVCMVKLLLMSYFNSLAVYQIK